MAHLSYIFPHIFCNLVISVVNIALLVMYVEVYLIL